MAQYQLKRWDRVRLRRLGTQDEWCDGFVMLAGGTSVLVFLRGILRTNPGGAYVGGFVPLTVDYDRGKIVDLVTDTEFEMEVQRSQATYSPTD